MVNAATRYRRTVLAALLAGLAACGSDGGTAGKTVEPTEPARNGAVVVVVRGLPPGVAADIEFRGPGLSRRVADSTTVENLSAATYTLAVNPVETPRYRFAPDTANRQIVITRAGETRVVVVEYLPSSGQLAISVVGLRPDLAASIDVSGPGGFAQHLTAADTLWRLTEGLYTVRAGTPVSGNVRFVPAAVPAVLVAKAQTAASAVSFTGFASFTIEVAGLPTGVAADVDFAGGGTTRHLSASSTVADLLLGSYSLTARDVKVGNDVYRAPAAQTISVTENGAVSATVRYARQGGRIAFAYAGLPQGLGAADEIAVTVMGPGSSFTITKATVLTDLPMGDYFVTAATATFGGAVVFQMPSNPPQSAIRLDAAHPDANATIPFQFMRGAYDVEWVNAPAGFSKQLTLTGPNNFYRSSDQNETVKDLIPGTYTLRLPITVGSNPLYYRNDPLPSTITLSAETPRVRLAIRFHEMVWSTLVVTAPGLPAGVTLYVLHTGGEAYAPVTLTHLYPWSFLIGAVYPAIVGDTAAWVAVDRSMKALDLKEGLNTVSFPVRQTNIVNLTTDRDDGLTGAGFVTLTAPNGARYDNSYSAQWTDLPPGLYTVTASTLPLGSGVLTPSVATQMVTIPAIGHVRIHVHYTVVPP